MTNRSVMIGAVAVLAAFMTVGGMDAFSQQGGRSSTAERRLHPGGGFWANDAASRRIDHALDYSRGLQRYSQYVIQPNQPIVIQPGRRVVIQPAATQPGQPVGQPMEMVVQPSHELVTTHVREIGVNIVGAQERMMEVRATAEQSGDQASLDGIKSVSAQLAIAAAEQKKCMEECKSGAMDMAEIMRRCQAITAALDKAKAEHDKLMTRLYPPTTE